eukprot:656178-Amphidinium_carterae.1
MSSEQQTLRQLRFLRLAFCCGLAKHLHLPTMSFQRGLCPSAFIKDKFPTEAVSGYFSTFIMHFASAQRLSGPQPEPTRMLKECKVFGDK